MPDESSNEHTGTPAASSGQIKIGPYLNDSGSAAAFGFLGSLYGHCLNTHAECRKTYGGEDIGSEKASKLPSRVLDLSAADDSIRLVATKDRQGHFAALSYCWGPPEKLPPRTTTTTIAAHTAGMREEQLPQTYRDAIRISRHAGLRYLWIDSLCIIQDDPADWQREAARMASVYQTAQLVVAAADSPDPSTGIFRHFGPAATTTLPYFAAPGRASGTVHAELRPAERDANPEHSILSTRAWCAQESALARRIVYYTRKSVVWNCRQLGYAGLCCDGVEFSGSMWQKRVWSAVARDYSRRSLTYARDKLVAVQGVVSELARATGDAYLYGCWKGTLAGNLLWSRGQLQWLQRPAELRDVPTWSWASTMGAVDVFEDGAGNADAESEPCVAIEVDESGKKLRLEARLVPSLLIALSEEELDALDMPKTVRQIQFTDSPEPCGIAILDQDDAGLRDDVVFCVPLMWEHPETTTGFESEGRHLCLIVQRASKNADNHFVRLGKVLIDQGPEVQRSIDTAPTQSIVLV